MSDFWKNVLGTLGEAAAMSSNPAAHKAVRVLLDIPNHNTLVSTLTQAHDQSADGMAMLTQLADQLNTLEASAKLSRDEAQIEKCARLRRAITTVMTSKGIASLFR